MSQGVLFQEMIETGFDLLGDGARPTWTMTIE
jgi:hypothetical protein